MRAIIALFIVLSSATSYADLTQKFNEELYYYPTNITNLQTTLSKRHVIMWAGFRNEMIPDYFEQNVESLNYELKAGKVSIYTPSSLTDISVIAARSYEKLMAFYKAGGNKPLVIFAHSKGASEAIMTLTLYPQLLTYGIVDRLVSVQGSIGGSPLSDLYAQYVKPLIYAYGSVIGAIIIDFIDNGAGSMRRDEAQLALTMAISKLNQTQYNLLARRIFYVRSQQVGAKLHRIFKITGKVLAMYGANDGAILTADMYRPDFGYDLGVFDSDHSDFVSGIRHSNQTREFKYAFTRAVFREIFEH